MCGADAQTIWWTGIHREDLLASDGAPDEARLAKAVARAGAVPTYATQRFLW